MSRWILATLTLTVLGCGNKDAGDTAPVDTSIFDATIPSDSPVLRNCEALCRLNNSGANGKDNFFQWTVSCLFDDPQGADTVGPLGEVRVEQNDVKIVDLTMVCGIRTDDTARCEQSYGADNIGVSCQVDPESYEWNFKIYDFDGNEGSASVVGHVQG